VLITLQGEVSDCDTEIDDLVERLFVDFDIDDLPLPAFAAEMETEFAIQRPLMLNPSDIPLILPCVLPG
jgi:hypothetical protein